MSVTNRVEIALRLREIKHPNHAYPVRISVPTGEKHFYENLLNAFETQEISSLNGIPLNKIEPHNWPKYYFFFLSRGSKPIGKIPLKYYAEYEECVEMWVNAWKNLTAKLLATYIANMSAPDFQKYFLVHNADKKSVVHEFMFECILKAHQDDKELRQFDDFLKESQIAEEPIYQEHNQFIDKLLRFIKAEIVDKKDKYSEYVEKHRGAQKSLTQEQKIAYFKNIIDSAIDAVIDGRSSVPNQRLDTNPALAKYRGRVWIFKKKCMVPEHHSRLYSNDHVEVEKDDDDYFGNYTVRILAKRQNNPSATHKSNSTDIVERLTANFPEYIDVLSTNKEGDAKLIVLWRLNERPVHFYDHNKTFKSDKESAVFKEFNASLSKPRLHTIMRSGVYLVDGNEVLLSGEMKVKNIKDSNAVLFYEAVSQ